MLPGILPRPAELPGIGRWQVETVMPRRHSNAVDWSPDRKLIACGIATVANAAAVIAFNVYRVHGGYLRAGMTREEQFEALDEAAQRECHRLLERVDSRSVPVQCKCAPDLRGAPVPVVLEAVTSTSADLIVIGARGRTGAAGVLLGTVTEQLIRKSPVPVLAVKKKGECIGILRALVTLAGEG